MAKYISVPLEVEAIQFTGGVESARDVVNWLNENGGGSVTHTTPVEGGKTFETALEHLTIKGLYLFNEVVVTVGAFIIIKDDGEMDAWDGEMFKHKFVKKDDK